MSTTQPYADEETRSSAEIESGIRSTRQRMDNTLDELGNRLNPRSLVNSALDWWETKSGGTAGPSGIKQGYRSLVTHVKNNPVPALLIGAGAAWLILRSDEENGDFPRQYRSDYYSPKRVANYDFTEPNFQSGEPGLIDKLRDKAAETKDAVSSLIDSAKGKADAVAESVSSARDKVQDWYGEGQRAASGLSRTVEQRYDGLVTEFRKGLEDYPLALGAGFLALGALAGVLLPPTRREDRLVGDKSDALVEAAKEKGDELLEQGKAAAEQVGDNLLEEARQKGLTPENAGQKLTAVAEEAGELIRKAAETTVSVVKEQTPAS